MTDGTEQMDGRQGNGWRIAGWSTVAGLILLPWIAMQLTKEVNWTAFDFVAFGGLLVGLGVILEIVVWKARSLAYRAGVGLALLAVFLLLWATGAVGIIGSEDNPANALFLGVMAVAFVGAVIARFRAAGMARAMLAAAGTQVLVCAFALARGAGGEEASWPWDLMVATAVFAGLWSLSAGFFLKAAQKP